MSLPNIPFLVSGEILDVYTSSNNAVRPINRYTVRCKFPNGQIVDVPNVVASTMFGGIDDFLQIRSRASNDVSYDANDALSDSGAYDTVGDRVYVAFVNGSLNNAVIIAYQQHVKQTPTITTDDDPSLNFRYLGFDVVVSPEGEVALSHNGAPDISYVSDDDFSPAIGEDGPLGAANPAVDRPSSDYRTVVELLKLGEFRVRDSIGQVIEVNNDENRILITNNSLDSSESGPILFEQVDGELVDAECILFDADAQSILVNARDDLALYSGNTRTDTVEGIYSADFQDDVEWDILGDWKLNVAGDITTQVKGDVSTDIFGDYSVSVVGDIDIGTKEQGFLSISGGTVALGGVDAELLDLFDQALQNIDMILQALESATFPSPVGPTGPAINLAQFVQAQVTNIQIKTLLATIKQ